MIHRPAPEARAREVRDTAPLGGPPDSQIHASVLMLLLRALRGEEVDGDGPPRKVEVLSGASPFVARLE